MNPLTQAQDRSATQMYLDGMGGRQSNFQWNIPRVLQDSAQEGITGKVFQMRSGMNYSPEMYFELDLNRLGRLRTLQLQMDFEKNVSPGIIGETFCLWQGFAAFLFQRIELRHGSRVIKTLYPASFLDHMQRNILPAGQLVQLEQALSNVFVLRNNQAENKQTISLPLPFPIFYRPELNLALMFTEQLTVRFVFQSEQMIPGFIFYTTEGPALYPIEKAESSASNLGFLLSKCNASFSLNMDFDNDFPEEAIAFKRDMQATGQFGAPRIMPDYTFVGAFQDIKCDNRFTDETAAGDPVVGGLPLQNCIPPPLDIRIAAPVVRWLIATIPMVNPAAVRTTQGRATVQSNFMATSYTPDVPNVIWMGGPDDPAQAHYREFVSGGVLTIFTSSSEEITFENGSPGKITSASFSAKLGFWHWKNTLFETSGTPLLEISGDMNDAHLEMFYRGSLAVVAPNVGVQLNALYSDGTMQTGMYNFQNLPASRQMLEFMPFNHLPTQGARNALALKPPATQPGASIIALRPLIYAYYETVEELSPDRGSIQMKILS